jgi:hypothetical protein
MSPSPRNYNKIGAPATLGDIKTLAALTLAHPCSPLLTLAHPPRLPSPTAVRSTNRLTGRGSILGPWSARPKWAPTTASFLAVAQNEGKVTLEVTLKVTPPPSPSPILSFVNFSRRPLPVAVVYPLVRFYYTPTFRYYSLLNLLLFALNCYLYPLLLPSSPSRANGSKTHRRRMPPNSSAERVGAGGP